MATRESPFYISDEEYRRIAKEIREDAKGGESLGDQETMPQGDMGGGGPVDRSRPCIVINPKVFSDNRDALCVAYNEAFRVVMEENGFNPVSEPTEEQRRFFADTAYAEDENMLRRTILARIATFDTSVKDPTDEQLEETMEMLEMVMEVGAPQSQEEQSIVQRIHDVLEKARGASPDGGDAETAEETPAETETAEGAPVEEGENAPVEMAQPEEPRPEAPPPEDAQSLSSMPNVP